jgi:hypothetical protein
MNLISAYVDEERVQLAFACVGVTLRQFVEDDRAVHKIDESVSQSLCQQMLQGVEYCHAQGIALRNITSRTVFIDDGRAAGSGSVSPPLKLQMGGFSRAVKFPVSTRGAKIATSPELMNHYTPPEVLLGDLSADLFAADMWAAGCVLGKIASGPYGVFCTAVTYTHHASFQDRSAIGTLFQIFRKRGTPTEATWPGVSQYRDFSLNFPQWKEEPWSPKIQSKLGAAGISLLNSLLTMDPNHRVSARQALGRSWFSNLGTPLAVHSTAPEFCSFTRLCSRKPFLKKQDVMDLVESFARPHTAPTHLYQSGIDVVAKNESTQIAELPRQDFWMKIPTWQAGLRAYRVLVDWMIEVCHKCGVRDHALCRSVSILNRYLSIKQVQVKHFQCLGCAAMLISAKFLEEAGYEFSGQNRFNMMIWQCDNAFTKAELFEMEIDVLKTIEFDLRPQNLYYWILRFLSVADRGYEQQAFASHLAQLTMLCPRRFQYPPSHIVAAAILLSNHALAVPCPWSSIMVRLTGFSESDLKSCAQELRLVLEESFTWPLKALEKKSGMTRERLAPVLQHSFFPASAPCTEKIASLNKTSRSGRRATGITTSSTRAEVAATSKAETSNKAEPRGNIAVADEEISSGKGTVADGATCSSKGALEGVKPDVPEAKRKAGRRWTSQQRTALTMALTRPSHGKKSASSGGHKGEVKRRE